MQGVEFAGELTDFILQDLSKVDPGRAKDARRACAIGFGIGDWPSVRRSLQQHSAEPPLLYCRTRIVSAEPGVTGCCTKAAPAPLRSAAALTMQAQRRVTLIEANEVLGSFDARMREYAATRLHKQGVHLIQVLRTALLS